MKLELDWAAAFKLVGAAGAAFWRGIDPLTQTLLLLMGLDIAIGIAAAYVTKTVSSSTCFRGMAKKSIVLLLIAAVHCLTRTWELGSPLVAAVAGFYLVHELISIAENSKRAGLPLPPALVKALEKLRQKEGIEA